MPIIRSTYNPKGIFRNPDISTIYAATLRQVPDPGFEKERLELSDGDFLDLEWSRVFGSKKIIILLHGLAGNANRPYMKGMARIFNLHGWSALALNLRGCSMEMNRKFRSYHAGASDDLAEVVLHVLHLKQFDKIAICGFSLGGNISLKYLGENRSIPKEIIGGAAISVPCDLAGSLGAINRMRNFIYSSRFERNLKQNLLQRVEKFPEYISEDTIKACNSLRDIDELYTSRAHGFENAADYYDKSSSLQFLENLQRPALILNAKNDSFLSPSCYPQHLAENSAELFLETPEHGGHVGFVLPGTHFYHEKRCLEFLNSL
ncbi:MAG: alpha/beta fold hydrolase [Christiangramia sp.]|nr:alpha/beta hydrolase [Christiangramia sp.]